MYNKEKNATNKNLELRDDLFCQYCFKQCKNLNSLKQHEYRCRENPNSANISNKGIIAMKKKNQEEGSWNKGLTKESDDRIAKQSQIMHERYATGELLPPWLGRHHTEASKKKLSKALLDYNHADNKRNLHSKSGYYNNIYFMSTWELAYYIYMKDQGYNILRCTDRFKYKYKNQTHYYTPDFILNNIYIEIKGRETEKDLAKYKAVENLKVIYANEIKPMIDYVLKKFNIKTITELYT